MAGSHIMSERGQGNDDVGSSAGLPHIVTGPTAQRAGLAMGDGLDPVLPAESERGATRRFIPSFVRLVADEF